ncbi:MAG: sensor histidine kinase [bacterium]
MKYNLFSSLITPILYSFNFVENIIISKQINYYSKYLKFRQSLNDNYLKYEFFRTNILNTLSHELKTPLTIIKGYIQYMIKFSKEDNVLNIMNTMLNETYRLEEIISELIEVSKFYSNSVVIKRDVFSVNKLISMIVNKFEPKIKSKGMDIKVEISQEDFEMIADFEKIKYVVSELIENSVKYGKSKIILKSWEDYKGYYFEIIDNGIGMSKEVIKNVFNLFIRTENELNRKVYGLGVGLFLVKKIVEAHEGEIKIKSQVNKGTNVKIFIPKHFSKSSSLIAGK